MTMMIPPPASYRRKKPTRPTIPLGTPANQIMVRRPQIRINESVTAFGDRTGTPYFRYGDSPNGPERVEVTPPGQPGPSPVDPGAVVGPGNGQYRIQPIEDTNPLGLKKSPVSLATGGTAIIGTPAWSPTIGVNPDGTYYDTAGQPATEAVAAPVGALPSLASSVAAASAAATPALAYNAAQQATIAPQQALIGAKGATLAANQQVDIAQQGTIAPQKSYLDAAGNVITAQSAETAGKKAYIGSAQGANAAALAEEQAIQAAAANTADKTAVARK